MGYSAGRCIIDNTNLARLRGTGKHAVIAPEMAEFSKRYGFQSELVSACRIMRRFTLDVLPASDRFPFEFCREPRPGPCGEGVRLEIGYVRDRCMGIPRLPATMREVLITPPIEWRADFLAAHPCPAIGKPKRRGIVTAIGNELRPLHIRHEA